MRQPGEPSVDEILDSIKKVIARDDRAGLAAREQPHDDDVLDLAVGARQLPAEDEPGAPLMASTAHAAMRDSLTALAVAAEPGAPSMTPANDTSLEALVREMLRPALAKWLDQHLPAMVERLVASEIARIVGKQP